MNAIIPHDLPAFLRRYRLKGGLLRRVRIRYPKPNQVVVEFRLRVLQSAKNLGTEPKPVRLLLRLAGVEEFRFQMRPSQSKGRIEDARIAHLNGLFYMAFDSLGLDPGEPPQIFDFRRSEVFAAGRDLLWAEAV